MRVKSAPPDKSENKQLRKLPLGYLSLGNWYRWYVVSVPWTFNLRKNSKLDIILESFKEEIPNNFQTFSKNRRFEDTLRKTSKETQYIEIQSIRIILEIQNSNFRNNFGKSVLPNFPKIVTKFGRNRFFPVCLEKLLENNKGVILRSKNTSRGYRIVNNKTNSQWSCG